MRKNYVTYVPVCKKKSRFYLFYFTLDTECHNVLFNP